MSYLSVTAVRHDSDSVQHEILELSDEIATTCYIGGKPCRVKRTMNKKTLQLTFTLWSLDDDAAASSCLDKFFKQTGDIRKALEASQASMMAFIDNYPEDCDENDENDTFKDDLACYALEQRILRKEIHKRHMQKSLPHERLGKECTYNIPMDTCVKLTGFLPAFVVVMWSNNMPVCLGASHQSIQKTETFPNTFAFEEHDVWRANLQTGSRVDVCASMRDNRWISGIVLGIFQRPSFVSQYAVSVLLQGNQTTDWINQRTEDMRSKRLAPAGTKT